MCFLCTYYTYDYGHIYIAIDNSEIAEHHGALLYHSSGPLPGSKSGPMTPGSVGRIQDNTVLYEAPTTTHKSKVRDGIISVYNFIDTACMGFLVLYASHISYGIILHPFLLTREAVDTMNTNHFHRMFLMWLDSQCLP